MHRPVGTAAAHHWNKLLIFTFDGISSDGIITEQAFLSQEATFSIFSNSITLRKKCLPFAFKLNWGWIFTWIYFFTSIVVLPFFTSIIIHKVFFLGVVLGNYVCPYSLVLMSVQAPPCRMDIRTLVIQHRFYIQFMWNQLIFNDFSIPEILASHQSQVQIDEVFF